jgi:glycosyltransferase involved in cell wall biosynthesis
VSAGSTTYAVVTPARNEAANLPRLARSLARQSVRPVRWLVVDNGSTDATPEVVGALAREHDWIRLVTIAGDPKPRRGAPAVRAFHAGIAALDRQVEFVVNKDADIAVAPGYFACLLDAFAADPKLGIAGGTCYERKDGVWRQRFVTGTTVWGGSRMYRRRCLDDILPLEERLGWDGMADAMAHGSGWRTRLLVDLPFLHYRPEGHRDGAWSAGVAQGESAWFMGYRAWYLLLRAARAALRDRSGAGMVWGYASALARREPRSSDARIREHVRRLQSPSELPARIRESFGRRRAE